MHVTACTHACAHANPNRCHYEHALLHSAKRNAHPRACACTHPHTHAHLTALSDTQILIVARHTDRQQAHTHAHAHTCTHTHMHTHTHTHAHILYRLIGLAISQGRHFYDLGTMDNIQGHNVIKSVSYTHLTLPTIVGV